MKHLTKILYAIGAIIFLTALIIIGIAIVNKESTLRWVGIGIGLFSGIIVAVAFAMDFRKTMMIAETAGDQFTVMSKARLISLLDKHNIEYEEGRERSYYLTICRDNFERN